MLVPYNTRAEPVEVGFWHFGICADVRVTAKYHDSGLYPKQFTGVVETVYPRFALVRTDGGYYTTIHLADLICRVVSLAFRGGGREVDTGPAAANQ